MNLLWAIDIDLVMAERISQLKAIAMSDYDFRNRFEEIIFMRDTLKSRCKMTELTPESLHEFSFGPKKDLK